MKQLPQFPVLLISISIPLITPLLRIIENGLWLELAVWVPVLLWITGTMAGYLVLQLDQLLDILLTNPKTNLAMTVKSYFKEHHIQYGLRLLEANKHLQPRLTFRSALFQMVWVVLAIFTFTSTSSTFGKGFVLGIGVRLLLEQWQYYVSNRGLLRQWLFWQIKREVNQEELRWYLVAMTGIAIVLVLTVNI